MPTKPTRKPEVRAASGKRKPASEIRGARRHQGAAVASALQPKEYFEHVNPHVAPRGYATDGSEAHNIKTYKYPCPRDHYIQGPIDISAYAVAKIWGLRPDTVIKWRKDDKWDELKKLWLDAHPAQTGGNVESDALVKLQEEVVRREMEELDEMAELTMERIREKQEETVTPTGDIKKIRKKGTSFKAEIQSMREIQEARRVAAGLHTKMTGGFAGANINVNNGITEITQIVERRPDPVQTTDYKEKMRLELLAPDDDDKSNVVEGEVTIQEQDAA